jgi:hypothetical protein
MDGMGRNGNSIDLKDDGKEHIVEVTLFSVITIYTKVE